MRNLAIAITSLSLAILPAAIAGEPKSAEKKPAATTAETKSKTTGVSQTAACSTSCCSDEKATSVTQKPRPAAKGAMLLVRR